MLAKTVDLEDPGSKKFGFIVSTTLARVCIPAVSK
jgi:hypothetical protein